jgi:hypothetical protein
MYKPRYTLAVPLLAAALVGCEPQEEPVVTTRDVYKTLDECMLDWNDAALCGKAAEAQAQVQSAEAQAEAAKSAHTSGGGDSSALLTGMLLANAFRGPEYVPGERVAYAPSGAAIRPSGNRAASTVAAPATMAFRQAAVAGGRSLGATGRAGGIGG